MTNLFNTAHLEKIPMRWKYLNFIDCLLPFYVICTVPLFYLGRHFDFLFKGVTILTTLVYFIKYGSPRRQSAVLFSVFLGVVSFSFLQYVYNDRPISCYFGDASNYISAMLFFYVGNTDDRPGRTFYTRLMVVLAIIFAAGLFFFVTTPSWYLQRNLEYINASSSTEYNETNMFDQLRYGAFFGDSYSVSHLSVFCSAIALFDVAYTEGKNRKIALACLVVGLVASVASMHRASILGSVIAIIMFVYFNHKTCRYKYNVYVLVISIIVLMSLLFFSSNLGERVSSIFDMITERVNDNMSLNKALNERKNTKELMESMRYFIFGHGLGSGGGSIRSLGLPGITDMQYIKMFFENGIVGAVLFICLIVTALHRGLRYIKYYLTEVVIILFILVAMLGSNSLSIYYFIVYPFWYAVGRICNNNYFYKVKYYGWI